MITRLDDGTNLVDLTKTLDRLKVNNYIGANVRTNNFFIGYRGKTAAISFFINERVEADVFFPRDLIDFGINGNINFLDKTLELGKLAFNASHFREIGFGYTGFRKDNKFSWGYRVKLLTGFYNVSLPNNFEASLSTNPDNFFMTVSLNNADLRVTEVPEAGSLVFSPNIGLAFDAGIDYQVSELVSLAVSFRDLGFINWVNGVSHRELEDTVFTYNGVDISDTDNLIDALEDSLADRFNYLTESEASYRTSLPLKFNLSSTINLDSRSRFIMMVSPEFVQGFPQLSVGAGITRKIGGSLEVSLLANKLPQQGVNLGMALSASAGPVQVYVGSDKLIGYDLTGLRSFNFTFGINLVSRVKKSRPWKSTRVSEFSTNDAYDQKEKVFLNIQKEKKKLRGGSKKNRKQ